MFTIAWQTLQFMDNGMPGTGVYGGGNSSGPIGGTITCWDAGAEVCGGGGCPIKIKNNMIQRLVTSSSISFRSINPI